MAKIIALTRAAEPGDTVLINLDLVTLVTKVRDGTRLYFSDPKVGFDVAESLGDIYERATD